MKNNKGFTLVELLAVILILLGLAGVTLFGITSILSNREEKELEQQKELTCGAAKIYFSLNKSATEVTIETLKSDGYFNSTSKTDQIASGTKFTINSEKKIKISGENCPE